MGWPFGGHDATFRFWNRKPAQREGVCRSSSCSRWQPFAARRHRWSTRNSWSCSTSTPKTRQDAQVEHGGVVQRNEIKTARNGVAGRNGALGKCCGCKPLLHQKFQVPNQKWRYGTKPHYRAISGFRFPLHKPDPYSFRYQISGFATCHPQHHKSPRRLSSFSAPFRVKGTPPPNRQI